jgi:hypothetical protein
MRRDKIVCTLGVCANLAGELVQNLSVNTTAIDLCEDFEPCKRICLLLVTRLTFLSRL